MKNTYKKIKFWAVMPAIAVLSFACTEDIDLDLDTTYVRLVVEGAISTDTTRHQVILSRSGDPLNKEPIVYISGASVTISDGTETFILNENANKKGVYETNPNVFGLPGKTYFLEISNVDVNGNGVTETYTASSELRQIAIVDSIGLTYERYDSINKGWLINLFGTDPGGRNYYVTQAEKNGILLTDSIKEFGSAVNAGFSGAYYPGLAVYYLDNTKPDERLKKGDKVTLVLKSITEEYYNFILGFQAEYRPKTPIFSGPSANVKTNIYPKDKAVGFFAAYSVSRTSTVFNQDPIENEK